VQAPLYTPTSVKQFKRLNMRTGRHGVRNMHSLYRSTLGAKNASGETSSTAQFINRKWKIHRRNSHHQHLFLYSLATFPYPHCPPPPPKPQLPK